MVSVSIAEEEVGGIGIDNIVGQLTAWNYYQTVDSPENTDVRRGVQGQVRRRPRDVRPDGGGVHVALPVEGAWSRRPSRSTSRDVQEAAGGVTFDAPEGTVTVNGDNHHIAKTALIGKIGPDGLIYTEWSSDGPIEPDPFLEGYDWAEGLS